jgi:PAS domain S-box-containing protein
MSQKTSKDAHVHFQPDFLENAPQGQGEQSTDQIQENPYQLYLAAIVESSDDAILGKTLDGIITSWNPAAERLYGYTAQEIIGQSIATIVPEELRDDLTSIMQRLKDGQKIDHYETTRVRKDGVRITVMVTISPIKDALGKIIGASTIGRDITAQRKAEKHAQFLNEVSKVLASSLDYQTTLSDLARLVVPQFADWFTVDLVNSEGHLELVEVAHKDPAKVQWAKELRKHYLLDLQDPNGVPRVIRTGKAELYAAITDEMLVASARTEEELALYRQVGVKSVMLVPLIVRGNVFGALTFISIESGKSYDPADLALAEEISLRAGIALDNAIIYRQAQQARDELHAILQNVADGITVQDTKGSLIYVNDVAAQFCGFSSAEAMVMALRTESLTGLVSTFTMKDEVGNLLSSEQLPGRRALAGERNVQAIVRYENIATGQTHWSLVKAEPIFDEYGQVQLAVNVFTDITERYVLEQRKDEFIRMASHELKTPITALKGFTNLLQRRIARQGDESSLSFLAKIDVQLNKLTKLISDLLDVSKIQVGKLEYREEDFDLDVLVQETIEIMQGMTKVHQLQFEGQENIRVFGDRDRIGQVLINLLTNAMKYSPQADKVIVRVSANQEHAVLSVQDFGIGIVESYQARIFERFYQVMGPEEKTYPGLGIGLFISHEIVMRHHGQIWLESQKGQGSTFYVSLPLRSAQK